MELESLIDFTDINPRGAEWDNQFALVTDESLLNECATTFLNGIAESIAYVPSLTNGWWDFVFDCAHAIMFFPDGMSLIFYMHDRKQVIKYSKLFLEHGGMLVPAYTLIL
jgi:hypothetical protein